MKRLQGKEFLSFRHTNKCHMLYFQITSNNNIKVVIETDNYYRVSHYLNDEEKERFLNSEYYKNSVELPPSKRYPFQRFGLLKNLF